jgi:hypothetical protein
MDWSQIRQRPVPVWILQLFCLLICLNQALVLVRAALQTELVLQYTTAFLRSSLPAVFWFTATVGVWSRRKWGWSLLFIVVLFSALNISNLLATRQMGLSIRFVVFICASGLAVWLMTKRAVRDWFALHNLGDRAVPPALLPFAGICFAVGCFLIVELYFGNKMIWAVPVKVFITGMGVIFIVLGIGIWKYNRYALLAVQAVLIFALLSVVLIFGHGYFSSPGSFKAETALLYISSSVVMLYIWLFHVRPHLFVESEAAA